MSSARSGVTLTLPNHPVTFEPLRKQVEDHGVRRFVQVSGWLSDPSFLLIPDSDILLIGKGSNEVYLMDILSVWVGIKFQIERDPVYVKQPTRTRWADSCLYDAWFTEGITLSGSQSCARLLWYHHHQTFEDMPVDTRPAEGWRRFTSPILGSTIYTSREQAQRDIIKKRSHPCQP